MGFNPGINTNQAIIVKVVEVAGELTGSKIGRTTLQKVLYFLQVCDVPVRYKFDVHHYGPFCAEVLHDTEWLAALEVIEDRSDDPGRRSEYHVTNSGMDRVSEFTEILKENEDTIKSVVSVLVPIGVDELELIATLHYAYREMRASMSGEPTRKSVVDRFKVFKKEKFDSKEVEAACSRMAEAELVSFSD